MALDPLRQFFFLSGCVDCHAPEPPDVRGDDVEDDEIEEVQPKKK